MMDEIKNKIIKLFREYINNLFFIHNTVFAIHFWKCMSATWGLKHWLIIIATLGKRFYFYIYKYEKLTALRSRNAPHTPSTL